VLEKFGVAAILASDKTGRPNDCVNASRRLFDTVIATALRVAFSSGRIEPVVSLLSALACCNKDARAVRQVFFAKVRLYVLTGAVTWHPWLIVESCYAMLG